MSNQPMTSGGWVSSTLINLADFHNGCAFKEKDWSTEGLPIIRIEQINNPLSDTDKFSGLLSSVNRINTGDLIFSWSATLKVVIWNHGAGALNQHLYKVVPKSEITLSLLRYILDFNMDKLAGQSQGSTMKHVTRKELTRFKVLYPENTLEQKKISSVLERIDQAIESTQALIEKYQLIKAGLMHDLFTRGIGADGKLRPPREKAPELYQETAIGWIPKEWGCFNLKTCLIDNPTNGIYKPPELIGRGILMVGQTAFTKERSIDFSLCRRGVIATEELRYYRLEENNILITRVFATVNGVGLPTLVPNLPEAAVYESNMMRLRINDQIIFPRLLFEWLRSPVIRRCIHSSANASNQVSINQKSLNALPIPEIDIEEQQQVVEKINSIDDRLFFEVQNLRKLREQKAGLMHDLLTGKVQVKVDNEDSDKAIWHKHLLEKYL